MKYSDPLYFSDLNTDKIFVPPHKWRLPIQAPSESILNREGKEEQAGFKAVLYARGECPDNLDGMIVAQAKETEAKLAYLGHSTRRVRELGKEHTRLLAPFDEYSGQRVAQVPDKSGAFPQLHSPMHRQGVFGRLSLPMRG